MGKYVVFMDIHKNGIQKNCIIPFDGSRLKMDNV